MVVDPDLGDKVQVTLVATGLRGKEFRIVGEEEAPAQETVGKGSGQPFMPRRPERKNANGLGVRRGAGVASQNQAGRARNQAQAPGSGRGDADPGDAAERTEVKKAANGGPPMDLLDIPAFLRKNVD